jgi:hypothetical protein
MPVAGSATTTTAIDEYSTAIRELSDVRIALFSGVLVKSSNSSLDVLLVGTPSAVKLKSAIKVIEKGEGREINYSVLSYDEFYYRLSVRDKFITEILNGKYTVVIDTDNVLSR